MISVKGLGGGGITWTCQKRFSGFCPLRGGGVPPFSAKEKILFFHTDFPLRGGGGPPNSAKEKNLLFCPKNCFKRWVCCPLVATQHLYQLLERSQLAQMKCKWLRRVTGSLTEMSCTAQNKWKCLLLKWLSVGSVKRAVQSNNPKDKDCGQSYYPSMTYKYAGFKILTENQGDSYFTKYEISIFACSLVHWF